MLTVDVEMHTVDGYRMSAWARGYSDFAMRPDLWTLRRAGGTRAPRWSSLGSNDRHVSWRLLRRIRNAMTGAGMHVESAKGERTSVHTRSPSATTRRSQQVTITPCAKEIAAQ